MVVAGGAARIHTRVEIGRRLQILMTQQLPNQLNGAWRVVEQDFRSQVAELMRRKLYSCVLAHDPSD